MNEIDRKLDTLGRSLIGAELDANETRVLAERMGVQALAEGEALVNEGEDRRTLFLLAEGGLSIGLVVGDREEVVYRMHVGEVAGTRAFVDGSARKAVLRALEESLVLTLEPAAFESLIESHPRLVYKVMRALFRVTHANLMRVNMELNQMRTYLTQAPGRY